MQIEPIDDFRWRIPRHGGMRVDGIVYADDAADGRASRGPMPAAGVQRRAPAGDRRGLAGDAGHPLGLRVPDRRRRRDGRGDDGVISPGGVGYDINCGVRLLRSGRAAPTSCRRLPDIVVAAVSQSVPTGVGSSRRDMTLVGRTDSRRAGATARPGPSTRGFGRAGRSRAHRGGRVPRTALIPTLVSATALERGADQFGTLGSGNHFVELQCVDRDLRRARRRRAFGLRRGPGHA